MAAVDAPTTVPVVGKLREGRPAEALLAEADGKAVGQLRARQQSEELGQCRPLRRGSLDVMEPQPFGCLLATEGRELDGGGAASRPRHGRMEPSQHLVGRHEDEDAETLSDDPVDDVEQSRQPLAGLLLGVGSEQLARVLEDEQRQRASSSAS